MIERKLINNALTHLQVLKVPSQAFIWYNLTNPELNSTAYNKAGISNKLVTAFAAT